MGSILFCVNVLVVIAICLEPSNAKWLSDYLGRSVVRYTEQISMAASGELAFTVLSNSDAELQKHRSDHRDIGPTNIIYVDLGGGRPYRFGHWLVSLDRSNDRGYIIVTDLDGNRMSLTADLLLQLHSFPFFTDIDFTVRPLPFVFGVITEEYQERARRTVQLTKENKGLMGGLAELAAHDAKVVATLKAEIGRLTEDAKVKDSAIPEPRTGCGGRGATDGGMDVEGNCGACGTNDGCHVCRLNREGNPSDGH